ncbi:DNA polymerase/3'-5' exonuclease PolX [Rosistilla oblonga]|uniref:DNA polymerase/3'-5' exonuclease PolX n=1 Tax=Rosistilla oblonga TaxID=2527990 RepID=UPI003A96AA90
MDNQSIAEVFEQMAELLEFKGENPFRIRAYHNGAKAILDLEEPVAQILDDPSRKLSDVPGIGKTLVDKITVLVSTGSLPQLLELQEQFPASVLAMARVPGLGAKKAARLHQELGIDNLAELKTACETDQVSGLKGFGKKSQQTILDGLAIAQAAAQRKKWVNADGWVARLRSHLSTCDAIARMEFAGSYRRGRETCGDLDILVVADPAAAAMDHLEAFPPRKETILRGDTKISIRVDEAFQVDMRVVAADQFGAALQYFTGSQAHNVRVRSMAKAKGLKVNEYGVFREDDPEHSIAGGEEQEVYAAIGLPWVPPELREDRLEFDWAKSGDPFDLIELKDICSDLHMHTTATDGEATIGDMADAAIARGLTAIAITDHSQRVAMARGLDPQRLREQWARIDQLRPQYEGRLTILKGIECDILEDGGMDLPDDVLAEADWVLASVHYGQRQSREQITDRILGAIANPHVTAIAHPTGRLINRREAYQVDIDAVFQAAAETSTLLELNANPSRLDLHEVHCQTASRRYNIPIVINTDAHSIDGLDVMQYGILQARRAGLQKQHVANARSWDAMKPLMGKYR